MLSVSLLTSHTFLSQCNRSLSVGCITVVLLKFTACVLWSLAQQWRSQVSFWGCIGSFIMIVKSTKSHGRSTHRSVGASESTSEKDRRRNHVRRQNTYNHTSALFQNITKGWFHPFTFLTVEPPYNPPMRTEHMVNFHQQLLHCLSRNKISYLQPKRERGDESFKPAHPPVMDWGVGLSALNMLHKQKDDYLPPQYYSLPILHHSDYAQCQM